MYRAMWTDERLDDLSHRVDAGFERVDKDIRELRADIGSLRLAILQVGGGLVVESERCAGSGPPWRRASAIGEEEGDGDRPGFRPA